MCTNAQSLPGKVSKLSCIAAEHNPDLLLVTETWCNSDITNAVLSIEGYDLIPELRLDRAELIRGVVEVLLYMPNVEYQF